MRNNYVNSIVEFLTMFRENQIHPIFIFDGNAPDEKHNERVNRSEKRYMQKKKIKSIERDLDIYKQTNEATDLLKNLNLKSIRLVSSKISIQYIQDYVDKLKSYVISLTDDDFETMKKLLKIFGIPFITGPGEGEFMCSALARHGFVDAVFTADTDVLPCLAPCIINKIIDNKYFQVIDLSLVLSGLKVNEKQFIDLCIMCGTDFNSNIQKIGPISSYDLILRYKNIESLPQEYDTSILNYDRVRNIFGFTDDKPEITIPYCDRINYDQLEEYYSNIESIKNRINMKFIVVENNIN